MNRAKGLVVGFEPIIADYPTLNTLHYQLSMNNDIGFNPVADTIAVLSQLEIIYFIPVVIIFAIMFLTGTFKQRYPRRYTLEAGKGFVRMDVKAKFESLPLEQQEKLKKRFDSFKT